MHADAQPVVRGRANHHRPAFWFVGRIEDCARRELREETGLGLLLELTACGTTERPCYLAHAPLNAQVTLDAEHDRFEWVAADVAPARSLPDVVRLPLRQDNKTRAALL